ncbi:DUF2878 domain-containing protein [Vibrio gallicus]|uniref:DUF2878 domain-containing protein n=1 Tax=Vibrio gallicus TaxID=190897 RepID=UPI0021C403B1|nr:DUF2878 domain-containing protein [Vibrio gallicus]
MNKVLVVKSLWFQSLWFLAVIGRDSTLLLLWFAIVATLAFSVVRRELAMGWLSCFVVLGVVLDWGNAYLGLFTFPTPFIPLWLIALWIIFVWYAYQMKTILTLYPIWAVSIISALGAAGSYFAGAKLGAVIWPQGNTFTLLVLIVEWSVLMSLLVVSLRKRRLIV